MICRGGFAGVNALALPFPCPEYEPGSYTLFLRQEQNVVSKQNPDWTEDELTLAFWTLRRLGSDQPSKHHPRVLQLSRTLNRLPIHPNEDRAPTFRDPDGVRRRLTYLAQINAGDKVSGHSLYYKVWEQYHADYQALENAARQILEEHGIDPDTWL